MYGNLNYLCVCFLFLNVGVGTVMVVSIYFTLTLLCISFLDKHIVYKHLHCTVVRTLGFVFL